MFCTNLSSSSFSMINKVASFIEQATRPSAQGLEIWEIIKHLFRCGCQCLGHSSMADLPVCSVPFSWAATLHFSIGGFCTRNLTKTPSPIRFKRRRISPAQPSFRAKWCQCGHRQASVERDGNDACLCPGDLNVFTLPYTLDVSIGDKRWEPMFLCRCSFPLSPGHPSLSVLTHWLFKNTVELGPHSRVKSSTLQSTAVCPIPIQLDTEEDSRAGEMWASSCDCTVHISNPKRKAVLRTDQGKQTGNWWVNHEQRENRMVAGRISQQKTTALRTDSLKCKGGV